MEYRRASLRRIIVVNQDRDESFPARHHGGTPMQQGMPVEAEDENCLLFGKLTLSADTIRSHTVYERHCVSKGNPRIGYSFLRCC